MGLFDKVKKILFDEEEIEDLPVRNDKEEKGKSQEDEVIKTIKRETREEKKGGVIIHNDRDYEDEDTITEVKVPVETPKSFSFPIMMDDEEEVQELPKRETLREPVKEPVREPVREQVREPIQDTQQLRLQEDDFDRTKEIERLREERLNKTRQEAINEYNEIRRVQRETVEPRRENLNVPEKKEKAPYKVPPIISPVFGVLDKNYDPDEYEQTRQKITLTNAGNTSAIGERQFGPVSYNDQGLPSPKFHSQTVIITTSNNPGELIKDELKRENEAIKAAAKIEEDIINTIINDKIDSNTVEDAFDDTKEITATHVVENLPDEEPIVSESVEEPTIEYDVPSYEEDDDAVITGSPYDDMFEEEEEKEEIKPKKSIKDLIDEQEETEEADITPAAPKNIEDNVDLDDTIETDLYNLIDSMYKDDE